jgi:hypothetical protein
MGVHVGALGMAAVDPGMAAGGLDVCGVCRRTLGRFTVSELKKRGSRNCLQLCVV